MESRMTELMEAIQESEGQAERRVLTLLGGRYISEKALVIGGKNCLGKQEKWLFSWIYR